MSGIQRTISQPLLPTGGIPSLDVTAELQRLQGLTTGFMDYLGISQQATSTLYDLLSRSINDRHMVGIATERPTAAEEGRTYLTTSTSPHGLEVDNGTAWVPMITAMPGTKNIGPGTFSATTGFIQSELNALLTAAHGTAAAPITDTANASIAMHRWDSAGGRGLWSVMDLIGTHSALPVGIQSSMLDNANIAQERIALAGQSRYISGTTRADTNPLIGITGLSEIVTGATGDTSLIGIQAEVMDEVRDAPSTYPANNQKIGLKVLKNSGAKNMTAGIVVDSNASTSGFFRDILLNNLQQTGVLIQGATSYNCTVAGAATCAGYSGAVSLASGTAGALFTGNHWALTTNNAGHSVIGYNVDLVSASGNATLGAFLANGPASNNANAYGLTLAGTWAVGVWLPGTFNTSPMKVDAYAGGGNRVLCVDNNGNMFRGASGVSCA